MHKAVLQDRTMVVKVGMEISNPQNITGGAVQGSVLGHNAVLESLDDNLLRIYTAKYVDDITIVEALDKDIPYDEDSSGNKPRRTVHPTNTQIALDTIATRAKKCS